MELIHNAAMIIKNHQNNTTKSAMTAIVLFKLDALKGHTFIFQGIYNSL